MKRVWWVVGVGLTLIGGRVQALPGQTAEEAALWIRTHPTLQPAPYETLLVRKSYTPAQRFTFQASLMPVGRASAPQGVIRAEEFCLTNLVRGVSRGRLEEALRIIYGPIVHQDYRQATLVYTYPDRNSSIQGEVREGDRYAYWLEIAKRPDGFAYMGKVTVFLRDDLPKLEAELRRP